MTMKLMDILVTSSGRVMLDFEREKYEFTIVISTYLEILNTIFEMEDVHFDVIEFIAKFLLEEKL